MCDRNEVLADANLKARTKHALVVEALYSARDFDAARVASERILRHSNTKIDQGIAAYALARCHMREHRDDTEVYKACNLAAAKFLEHAGVDADSFQPGAEPPFLRWRLGLLYLVKGFTRWNAGDPQTAMSRLLMAKWCLSKTNDFIGLANVDLTIGGILRSKGEAEEAIPILERACRAYEHAAHHLNLARCLTNIGRAQKDAGRPSCIVHLRQRTSRAPSAITRKRRESSHGLRLTFS
jgi:tetratricopeptide (TPR) repeat protein